MINFTTIVLSYLKIQIDHLSTKTSVVRRDDTFKVDRVQMKANFIVEVFKEYVEVLQCYERGPQDHLNNDSYRESLAKIFMGSKCSKGNEKAHDGAH